MLTNKICSVFIVFLTVGCSGKNITINYDGINKPVSMSRAVYNQDGNKISTNELFGEKELKVVDHFSYQKVFGTTFFEKSDSTIILLDIVGDKLGNGDAIINLKVKATQQGPFMLLPFLSTETKVEIEGDVAIVADNDGVYGTISSQNVIFVIDVSRSMDTKIQKPTGGAISRIEYLKPRLMQTISSLGSNVRFNIMSFSSRAELWQPNLVYATSENKESAKNIVMGLSTNSSTKSMEAIQSAFSLQNIDTIYFLSDGEPTDKKPDYIIDQTRLLHKQNSVKINSIVFIAGEENINSKEKAKKFMKNLSDVTGGSYEIFE